MVHTPIHEMSRARGVPTDNQWLIQWFVQVVQPSTCTYGHPVVHTMVRTLVRTDGHPAVGTRAHTFIRWFVQVVQYGHPVVRAWVHTCAQSLAHAVLRPMGCPM